MNLCSQRGLKAAWLLAITLCGAPLGAQAAPWSDSLTSASLPEVSVLGGRWQTGAKPSVKIPCKPMGWSASELLRSGIDLRQTGPTGSAWISLDGLPSNHTWIQWEGMALSAADLGIMDIQLLPSAGLSMQRSADGLRLSSDSIGSLSLESSTLGNAGLNLWIPGKTADFGLSARRGLNRYRYRDYLGDRYWRTGAGTERLEFRSSLRSSIGQIKQSTHFYAVWLKQGLPESANVPRRLGAVQQDLRATVIQRQEWNSQRWEWSSTQHVVLANQTYDYPLLGGIHDSNGVQTIGIRVQTGYRRSGHRLRSSLDVDRLMAEGPNKSPASVLRLQLMLRGEGMASPMLRYSWGLSQLRQGDELGTLLPFAELQRKGLGQKASWNVKLHRHQRFPTLNDLFWSPGGNPALRPELGWESRAKASHRMGSMEAYAGILRDAIFWMPTGSIWMPRNVESLRRIGINLASTWQNGPWQSQIAAQWVYSINNSGLRMPYVAPFTLNIPLRYRRKEWELEVFNRLRSATPTAWSSSRDSWIGPQFQLDAILRWQGPKSSVELALTNATNQPIYLQLGYPLPGRQWSLTWHCPLARISQ